MGDNRYYYQSIVCDNQSHIYASQWQQDTGKDGAIRTYCRGIYRYSLNDSQEELILQGKSSLEGEQIGFRPEVAKISKDGRWVYIWEKPASGSLTADGVPLGAWDSKEKQMYSNLAGEAANKDGYEGILAYPDNLSIHPVNGALSVVNVGGGREMLDNKHVVTYDITGKKLSDVSETGQITMTPVFSKDGNRIYYSASKPINYQTYENYNAAWGQWYQQQHAIFQYDVQTGERKQMTQTTGNTTYFDFAPTEIAKGNLLFLRLTQDKTALYQLNNGKEVKLADGIDRKEEEGSFYGHDDITLFLDVYTK